jgi:glyoxylase-like metal-dependent hydrolase (beta-lactamase superfamily II)
MKRGFVLGALIVVGALSLIAVGLQASAGQRGPQGPNVAEIQKVKDNLYMIIGGGGNTAAFITDAGVVVVDTKLAGWGQAILDKIKTVSNKPVTMIINTHSHPDHVGSNEAFPATVDVVAQEITKSNMEKQDAFKGDKAKFLPKKSFKDKMTLNKGKDEIDLFYFGRGHTGGDAWVLFPALRVLHAGDMFAGKDAPLVDVMSGGSAAEYGKTLAKAYVGIKGYDTIITGHSTLMKPEDLKEYADANNDFIVWVQSEMKAGKTVDQAAAEWKTPAKFPAFGPPAAFFGGIKGNIQAAYSELKK